MTENRHPPRPRLVLRVGITGHRPVPGREFDLEAIQAAMDEVLGLAYCALSSDVDPAYDRSHPRRLTLVSALASGADQIAASSLLKLREAQQDQGVNLHAILPFGVDDYSSTMNSEDAKRMRKLVDSCERKLILGDLQPSSYGDSDKLGEFRTNRRYETVGKMIVHQADLLIAVWNGLPSEGVGGTGDIVLHAVNEGVPVVWIDLAGAKCMIMPGDVLGDPFCTIAQRSRQFTDRHFMAVLRRTLLRDIEGSQEPDRGKRYSLLDYLEKEKVPETTRWIPYQQILAEMGKRAVRGKERKLSRGDAESGRFNLKWKLPTDYVRQLIAGSWPGFPFAPQTNEQSRLAEEWAAADAVATGLGHAYRSTYLLVMCLASLAVFLGLTGIVFHEYKKYFVICELVLISLAVGLHLMGQRRALHAKWMQSRELAERIRASWAPMLLGKGGRRRSRQERQYWGTRLCDAYLAEVGVPNLIVTKETLLQIAEAALFGIAEDQRLYHANNNKVLLAIHHRLESFGKWSLYIAIGISIFLLGLVLAKPHLLQWKPDIREPLEFAILALAAICAMLPTLGATAAALKYQGDFERFSVRSHETSVQLMRVAAELRIFLRTVKASPAGPSKIPQTEFLLDIFDELEKYLLADLEDWRSIYETREVPEPA